MKILKCDRCLADRGPETNDEPILKARGLKSMMRPGFKRTMHKIGERHVCQECHDLYYEVIAEFWGIDPDK